VTQSAYQRVMGTNPSKFQGANLPVEQVDWNEAGAYCGKVGLRLPTEAEWEYAARADTAGPRYADLDAVAWYGDNSGDIPLDAGKLWQSDRNNYMKTLNANNNRTHPVASKPPNRWGLHDMLGNVWEWVADWYKEKYYDAKAVADPAGPASGSQRVVRGGSWVYNSRYVRASYRFRFEPATRNFDIGFRCVGELR